jgi:hypothetical protein
MPVYRINVCPRCKADVSRRFGLIATPTVVCHSCRFEMRITGRAVTDNWGYNFMALAGLAIWGGMALLILASPESAAVISKRVSLPAGTIQERLLLAALSGVAAALCAIPFLVVGRIIGYIVGQRLLSELEREAPAGDLSPQEFTPQFQPGGQTLRTQQLFSGPAPVAYGVAVQPAPVQPPPARPPGTQGHGVLRFILRAFFCLVWAAVCFVGGTFVMAALAVHGITDPEQQAAASRHAGETWGVWLFFGSIGLAVLLSCLGVLPGTRRKRRQPAEA